MGRVRTGFTLVELLLATICLAVSAIGVTAGLRYANFKSTVARQRTLALNYAISQMEAIKSASANSTLVAGSSSTTVGIAGIPVSVSFAKSVVAVPSTPLYSCTVQLTWILQTETGSSTQRVTLDTLVWYGKRN